MVKTRLPHGRVAVSGDFAGLVFPIPWLLLIVLIDSEMNREDDSMDEKASQNKILALLAKEWDYSGPPGILDVSEIVAALPQAPSQTLAALKQLFVAGMVDMNQFKTSAFLTPEGYEAAEIRKRSSEHGYRK